MSKFKFQPIIHIPSFKEYTISGVELQSGLEEIGLTLPMGRLDSWYYYTDLEGWLNVIYNMLFKSVLYKYDKFDCENYALKAMNASAEKYGLNAFGMTIGDTPLGRHGFNILLIHEMGFHLWEPNDGFELSGAVFEIGDNGYLPDTVLI